jgi:hypothetical protein
MESMNPGRIGAAATGWFLLIFGCAMALIIGKGDINVIITGIVALFGGIYVLSLVDPSTRQFIGSGWPVNLCRLSAVIISLIMLISGLIGSINGIREMMIMPNVAGISLVLFSLVPLCLGFYVLDLTIHGVRY